MLSNAAKLNWSFRLPRLKFPVDNRGGKIIPYFRNAVGKSIVTICPSTAVIAVQEMHGNRHLFSFFCCCCCYLHYRWSLFKPLNVNFHSFDIRNWPILNVKQFTLIQILNTNAFFDEIWRWYLSHPPSYVIWSIPKTIVDAIKFKFHWEYSGWSSPLSVFPLPLFITIAYYFKTKKPVMNHICLMTVWYSRNHIPHQF